MSIVKERVKELNNYFMNGDSPEDIKVKVINLGKQAIQDMTDDERDNLSSLSHTLHFQYLLGLQSKPITRSIAGKKKVPSYKSVGVVLVSDIPIKVPYIPCEAIVDKDTMIDVKNIPQIEVKAGEPFMLNYYEFMFLIIRDEYSGYCSVDGDPQGCFLVPKMKAFTNGKQALPTPTINFKNGSPKETMVLIDYKTPDGRWAIKPEYAEKFGAFIKKSDAKRGTNKRENIPTPTVVAVALKKILNIED